MRGCFSIRIAFLMIAGTIALLVFGIGEIRDGLKFPRPVVIRYADFIRQKPGEGWFHITGCGLDVAHSAYKERESGKSIETAYVPLRDAHNRDEKTIHVLLNTEDPAILSTITQGIAGASSPHEALWIVRDVEGMVKSGLHEEGSKTREEIGKLSLGSSLDADSVYFQDGKKPSMAAGIGMTLAGIALLIVQVVYFIRKRGGMSS